MKRLGIGFLLAVCMTGTVLAQEPTYMEAATHPAVGQAYLRMLGTAASMDDAEPGDRQSVRLRMAYGLFPATALVGEAEGARWSNGPSSDMEFARAALLLKQRILQRDLGPLDTWRGSVWAGADFPGAKDQRDSAHVSPQLGFVTTAILGRNGLNGQIDWTGRDDTADRFRLNASHLYRLAPTRYALDTRGAWYTELEWLNEWTVDGRSRSDIAIGLLYEAHSWALEASVRLPLAEDDMSELNQEVAIGLRWLP